MAPNPRRVARYIDALLRDHRPPRFSPDEEELAALRQATAMSSARAGVDSPTPSYVASLRRRLEGQMEGTVVRRGGWTRRTILTRSGAMAAALFAGVALDRAGGLLAEGQSQELKPNHTAWVGIGKVQEVSYRKPLRFRAGGVEGFVFLSAGELRAVSAVCTHQGCLLQYSTRSENLECPCHGATFSSSGALVSYKLASPPRALPTIAVRQQGENIEVRVV